MCTCLCCTQKGIPVRTNNAMDVTFRDICRFGSLCFASSCRAIYGQPAFESIPAHPEPNACELRENRTNDVEKKVMEQMYTGPLNANACKQD
jgi:hypothetical protein